MVFSILNLKGGTAKTTSSMYLAMALQNTPLPSGGRTLLVDADPQGSALSWSELAQDLDISVVGLPVKDLHKRLKQFLNDYQHIVIDTPPGNIAIVRSSLLVANVALLPIPPSLLDIDRLRPTLELLEEVENFNNLQVFTLLTRVRRGTKSAKATREVLNELGLHVLESEIPLLESYAGSFGLPPDNLAEYGEALKEILALQHST